MDILIDALSRIDFTISWTHIGSGPLLKDLTEYASKKLNKQNIHFEFLGAMPNSAVMDYYQNNKISCFVNCSRSEGVPVSIMEAQSFGIPVIAPDVGGVAEQINNKTGILLPSEFNSEDLVKAIRNVGDFQTMEVQKEILNHWEIFFNSENNYTIFIKDLINTINKKTKEVMFKPRRQYSRIKNKKKIEHRIPN